MSVIIHAQKNESDDVITSIKISMAFNSDLGIKVINTTGNDSIVIGSDVIDFSKFLNNLQYFTVDDTGTVSYVIGKTVSDLDDSKIELDTSIPLSFVRANTVVNLGRL